MQKIRTDSEAKTVASSAWWRGLVPEPEEGVVPVCRYCKEWKTAQAVELGRYTPHYGVMVLIERWRDAIVTVESSLLPALWVEANTRMVLFQHHQNLAPLKIASADGARQLDLLAKFRPFLWNFCLHKRYVSYLFIKLLRASAPKWPHVIISTTESEEAEPHKRDVIDRKACVESKQSHSTLNIEFTWHFN